MDSPTVIRVRVPAMAAGPVRFTVTAAGGSVQSGTFTVDAIVPPGLTSPAPASVPEGTEITLTGVSLPPTVNVAFGGVPATVVRVEDAIRIVATVPAGARNGAITVSLPDGTVLTAAGRFVVNRPSAVITGMVPPAGPVGTVVTLHGPNLAGVTGLEMNGAAVAGYTIQPDGTLTIPIQAGMTDGTFEVLVEGSPAAATAVFIVTGPDPTFDDFDPRRGRPGDMITLTGTHFTRTMRVDFAGHPAVPHWLDAEHITVHVPPMAVTGDITITPAAGAPVVSPDEFTVYGPIPTVTHLEPNTGPEGTWVTIRGTGFVGVNMLMFTGSGNFLAADDFEVQDDTRIRFQWPAGEATGVVEVMKAGAPAGIGSHFTCTGRAMVLSRHALLARPLEPRAVTLLNFTAALAPAPVPVFHFVDYPARMRAGINAPLELPKAPVFHPDLAFDLFGPNQRPGMHSGPICVLNLKLPAVFYEILPEAVRTAVTTAGIAQANVDLFCVSQNMPYVNDATYQFKPHYWTDPLVPDMDIIDQLRTVSARIFDATNHVHFQGHPVHALVTENIRIQGGAPGVPGVVHAGPHGIMVMAGFAHTITRAFYSLAILGDRAAVTLHLLLNDADETALEAATPHALTFNQLLTALQAPPLGGTRASLMFRSLFRPLVTGVVLGPADLAGVCNLDLTGTAFTGATQVTVGGVAATHVTVVDDTHITARIPAPHGPGPRHYIVTTPWGGSGGINH